MTTEIVNPKEFGIEPTKANELMGSLPIIQNERNVLEEAYKDVIALDIDEAVTSKLARELRLKIRDNRTKGILVWHKTTKEVFLRAGQFVDAVKNKEIAINERMEETLEQIEKHFEIQEHKRKEELKAKRIEELKDYSEFVPFGIDLGVLDDEQYSKVLNGSKLQYEAKIESERKAEEERVAKEKADAERIAEEKRIESERIEAQRVENERLKKEAEKREKEIEAERKKQADILAKQKAESERLAKIEAEKQAKIKSEQEAVLAKEREEKAKLEAELKAKKDAEIKAENERKDAELKAKSEADKLAKAPIKKQLSIWVDGFSIAEINVDNEKKALIKEKFEAFKKWAKNEIESI